MEGACSLTEVHYHRNVKKLQRIISPRMVVKFNREGGRFWGPNTIANKHSSSEARKDPPWLTNSECEPQWTQISDLVCMTACSASNEK